jgi:hypothetical protein
MVTIDTLRADRLGCYGYSKIATPNLDRLASQGVLFEDAVAQTPLTPPSHASMFTGTNPNVHQVRGTGGFVLDASKVTLAEILQQHGWQTAAFVGAPVLKRIFGLNQGFETYDDRMPEPDPGKTSLENPSLRAATVVDRAVVQLIVEETFSGADFQLQSDGVCRLNPEPVMVIGWPTLAEGKAALAGRPLLVTAAMPVKLT